MTKKYDISIIMPAIRVPRWDLMYDSITRSCKKYSFQLVICGPFPLTEKLQKLENVKSIIDFGSPSRCAQMAALAADSDLIAHLVDDAYFLENSMDEAIDLYKSRCGFKDVVNLRYTEGYNYSGAEMPMDYWRAWHHPIIRLAGIPEHYMISCHHIINLDYFKQIGGYDCTLEYQNFNLHDLMFRIQHDGGRVINSTTRVTNCDLFPNGIVDHRPIEEAFVQHDYPLFQSIYDNPNALQTRKIDVDNWKTTSTVWNRRYKNGLPSSYNDIVRNN